MKISPQLTDDAILAELAARLTHARLRQKLSQQDLASLAGVAKRTVERLEAGEPAVLTNLIRVLRALNLIEALDALLPVSTPSPIEQLERRSKPRRRAARKTPKSATPKAPWTWGDEQ
jgi:transcriptional regulator with XRE-family HTH domain